MGRFKFCKMVHSFDNIYWMLSTTNITFRPYYLNLLAIFMHLTASMYTPTEDRFDFLFCCDSITEILRPNERVCNWEAAFEHVCTKSLEFVFRYIPIGYYMLLFVKHYSNCRAFVVLPLLSGPAKFMKSPIAIS